MKRTSDMIPSGAKDCAREGPEPGRLKDKLRKRREVRRMQAEQSRCLLEGYRAGDAVDLQQCPLQQAIEISNGYTGRLCPKFEYTNSNSRQ